MHCPLDLQRRALLDRWVLCREQRHAWPDAREVPWAAEITVALFCAKNISQG